LAALLTAALIAGLVAGLVATALQAVLVWPLIAQAELFEEAAEHAKAPPHHHDSQHAEEPSPTMRAALSVLTNVAIAVGYGLLMAGAMLATGRSETWRSGLAWGAAGYLAVVLAPALGLQPVPPGVETGALPGRQLWWIATALGTAAGLAMILLPRGRMRLYWAAAGIALLLLPHVIGAPVGAPEGAAPAELRRQFARMVLLASLPGFLVTGTILGWRMSRWRTGGASA
jgi:cobalt transporter subunit CbtA